MASHNSLPSVDYRTVELDGLRYVIVRESVFDYLCQRAGLAQTPAAEREEMPGGEFDLDRRSLAERLVRRRQAAGLSQAELARRAGVRSETLNRIERGRTTPDFATVRKLVLAMNAAEREALERQLPSNTQENLSHGNQS
jgi:ribosome-binding protein aMBF1 (putative translation factor)